MAIKDSLGNYILFSSTSTANTRLWSRDLTAAYNTFSPAKKKYYVLKNPPATVGRLPTATTCGTPKTIKLGNKTYIIDPNIYDALIASLALRPVGSLEELQALIKQVRTQLGIPAPIGVQLKNEPLRNIITKYTYPSVGDTWKQGKTDQPSKIGSLFKLGNYVTYHYSVYSTELPSINFWKDKFPNRTLNLKKAQYFYAQENDGCRYTRRYVDLFTTATRSGVTVLPKDALSRYEQFKIIDYSAFPGSNTSLTLTLAFLLADTSQLKAGVFPALFGAIFVASAVWSSQINNLPGINLRDIIIADINANSELIFIPLNTDLDLINDVTVPAGTGFYFPVTNGGGTGSSGSGSSGTTGTSNTGDTTCNSNKNKSGVCNAATLQNLVKNQFLDAATLQNLIFTFDTNV